MTAPFNLTKVWWRGRRKRGERGGEEMQEKGIGAIERMREVSEKKNEARGRAWDVTEEEGKEKGEEETGRGEKRGKGTNEGGKGEGGRGGARQIRKKRGLERAGIGVGTREKKTEERGNGLERMG
jgi:hypothetical protein